MKKETIKVLLLFVWTVIVIIGAVGTPLGISVNAYGIFIKVHHIIGFGVYSGLVSSLLIDKLGVNRSLAVSAVISFLFGVLVEALQLFFPHRSGQLIDLISNLIGIVFFSILVKFFYSITNHSR
jgi:VanZ family protein